MKMVFPIAQIKKLYLRDGARSICRWSRSAPIPIYFILLWMILNRGRLNKLNVEDGGLNGEDGDGDGDDGYGIDLLLLLLFLIIIFLIYFFYIFLIGVDMLVYIKSLVNC
ncbi:hypothetical protein ACOSP7_015987 [Xanthoceras sorbifolium]